MEKYRDANGGRFEIEVAGGVYTLQAEITKLTLKTLFDATVPKKNFPCNSLNHKRIRDM